MSISQSESDISIETVDPQVHSFKAVWTCTNPDLPSQEEHVMSEDTVPSLEMLSEKYTIHHHDTCLKCEDYSRSFEGDLDRVEVYDANDEIVGIVYPEELIDHFEMDEF